MSAPSAGKNSQRNQMTQIIGAVLAGGKSSRFDGKNKALELLAGKPLIQHVIDRLAPQVSTLIFSGEPYELVNVDLDDSPFDSPTWIPDLIADQQGPLVGVLSCLAYIQNTEAEWLLTSGCDTPLLPRDLSNSLLQCAKENDAPICVPKDGSRLQPANALWHRDLYAVLKAAVENKNIRSFHQFLDTHPHAVADWPVGSNNFINLNTQVDLENAEKLLQQESITKETS